MAVETDDAGDAADAEPTLEELRARNAALTEELRQLRDEYARARRAEYRRTAIGLVVVGAVAAVGGLAFEGSRSVLFALAGTGTFVGVLTYYLAPERFIAASVGEGVYTAFARTAARIEAELGLAERYVYVPRDGSPASVRLFVPQDDDYALPADGALDSTFVVAADERSRGVSFVPTGSELVDEFETALVGDLESEPEALADQLAEGLLEGFELADSVTWDLDADGTGVSFGVSGSAYGSVHRFDHPIASFLAVGLARGVGEPILVETIEDDGRADGVVACRWDVE